MRISPATLFDDAAARKSQTLIHLDRPLDIAADAKVTYDVGELAHLVAECAGWLAALGVGPGDRVALVKGNSWDFDLLAYAAVRLGAVPAKIRSNLPPAVLATMLQRLDARALVTTADTVEAGLREGIELTGLVPRTLAFDRPAPGCVTLDDVRGHDPASPVDRDDDDPLVVCPTSGTTGIPKLAVHTTATIIRRLAQFEAHRYPFFGGRPTDTFGNASAYSHGRTFCWTAVAFALSPRRVVIVSDQDPAHARPLLDAFPPDVFEALPATFIHWEGLAQGPDNPFRNVRLYISTYDAIHPPAVRTFLHASQRRSVVFMHGWGQSETGPLTFRLFTRRSVAGVGDRHPTTRNAGMPTPVKTGLKAVDPVTMEPVSRGTPGVIFARTRARCLTYLGEESRWAGKADGAWFNTGDLGIIGRSGVVTLLDREVDEIPGLSCLELEDVIDDRLPEVLECILLGSPDQLPKPVVVTRDGELDSERWREAVADLPELAAPLVMLWEEIPRTATGKVRRLELRKQIEGAAATHGTGAWT